MDVTAVKAAIKTWEHEFRLQHGRSATVEDVRAHPFIGEKYRLYKRLVKEGERRKESGGVPPLPLPPRTPSPPPRTAAPRASSAMTRPKPRPVASASNPDTRNPFSPAKKNQTSGDASHLSSSALNPFITPVKAPRPPPPDADADADAPPAAAGHDAAILKARKRLRGESVSPSPIPRDKRRRANGLDPPAHHRVSQGRSVSPPSAGTADDDDSFVDDSPVKVAAGSKAFVPLFEEGKHLSQPVQAKSKDAVRGRTLPRAHTMPSHLFGAMRKKGEHDGDTARDTAADPFGHDIDIKTTATSRVYGNGKEERAMDGSMKMKKKTIPGPKGLIPLKDDLFDGEQPVASTSTTTGTSRKRTLSRAAEHDMAAKQAGLLPPSPPPQQDGAERHRARGRGKAKATEGGRHKKRRVSEEDDETSSDVDVKLVTWRGGPPSPQAEGAELTLRVDRELQPFRSPRGTTSPELEKFEVDLPEEMRRVLALSPREVEREQEEEELVKGVLRGRRGVGGEVWAPGEIGGEDDWEGEGVPWQVAEL